MTNIGAMRARERRTKSREVYLSLVRLTEALTGEFQGLFKQHGLTLAQFNVLRILRGGAAEGVTCQDIGERLLNRVPDVTRLIDRMETAGLVRRARAADDRRKVLVTLTSAGRALVDELDDPVDALHAAQLEHLSDTALTDLDKRLRAALGATTPGG